MKPWLRLLRKADDDLRPLAWVGVQLKACPYFFSAAAHVVKAVPLGLGRADTESHPIVLYLKADGFAFPTKGDAAMMPPGVAYAVTQRLLGNVQKVETLRIGEAIRRCVVHRHLDFEGRGGSQRAD